MMSQGTSSQQSITQEDMRRLTFIKYLYGLGVEQSTHPQPLASASLLTFHDGIESFLQLAIEVLKATPKGKRINGLEEYFDLLQTTPIAGQITGKASLLRLNTARNGLKHQANFADESSIADLRVRVAAFFEDNTPMIFGIQFADISVLTLVRFDDTRTDLANAESFMQSGRYKDAMERIALAFHQLVADYTNHVRGHLLAGAPSMPRIYSAAIRGVKEPQLQKLIDDVSKLASVVSSLRETLDTLSLGLDNRAYQRFRSLTPVVVDYEGGTFDFFPRQQDEPTASDCYFCFNFVVESAMSLQEYVF